MYYLPLTIDARRIHVCKLDYLVMPNQNGNEDEASFNALNPVFGFIFSSNVLFSTYKQNVFLIPDKNKKLEGYNIGIKKCSNDYTKYGKTAPVYFFDIDKRSHNNTTKNDENNNTPFHIDERKHNFKNGGYAIRFKERNGTRIAEERFVVCIRYFERNSDDTIQSVCQYSFWGYCVNDLNRIASAAIDFGSEASQIKLGNGRIENLVERIRKAYYPKGFGQWIGENNETTNDNLWQYDSNTDFFKSIYFIQRNPDAINFGEKPNSYGKNSFVQTLLPLATPRNFYENLIQLPNLKLMDLLDNGPVNNNKQKKQGNDLTIPDDSEFARDRQQSNLYDSHVRRDIIRMILTGFVQIAMHTAQRKGFFCLTMLVPNVYNQQKVYDVIEGLYKDFDLINQDKFEGFEVMAVSESDASFLGAVNSGQYRRSIVGDGTCSDKDYYLIVDAGKGTTDFSIMQPSKDCVRTMDWNSLYRGGLPASGQVFTYAMYDAVWNYFKWVRGVDLDTFFDDEADFDQIRHFMNVLEDLKHNYDKLEEDPGLNTDTAECDTLKKVTEIIKLWKKDGGNNEYRVPVNTKKIISKKVDELTMLIVNYLKRYMDSQGKDKKFKRVILTGRAFLLNQFRESLVKKLIVEDLVADEKAIVEGISDNDLKTICLDGAVNAAQNKYKVNDNSELICRPEKEKSSNLLNKLIDLVFPQSYDVGKILFEGMQIDNNVNSMAVGIYDMPLLRTRDRIYFVGDGFLGVDGNGTRQHLDWSLSVNQQEITALIHESLFPYHSVPKLHTNYKPKDYTQTNSNNSGYSRDDSNNIPASTGRTSHSGSEGGSQTNGSVEAADF